MPILRYEAKGAERSEWVRFPADPLKRHLEGRVRKRVILEESLLQTQTDEQGEFTTMVGLYSL
jgi:hypothetical protein